jgi:hypothetical protein
VGFAMPSASLSAFLCSQACFRAGRRHVRHCLQRLEDGADSTIGGGCSASGPGVGVAGVWGGTFALLGCWAPSGGEGGGVEERSLTTCAWAMEASVHPWFATCCAASSHVDMSTDRCERGWRRG